MAQYCTPTVIQPIIPDAEMTPLERLILTRIFESERDGDAWYFFAEENPQEIFCAPRTEIETALATTSDTPSLLHRCVAEQLDDADAEAAQITLDFTATGYEPILQGILKRSKTLTHITVISSFTCSTMRPDGFGGMATLITRDAVHAKSTQDLLNEFLELYDEHEPAPTAPHDTIMPDHLFRSLTAAEEAEFRQWARDNWKPGAEPESTWHPAIWDEWQKLASQHASQRIAEHLPHQQPCVKSPPRDLDLSHSPTCSERAASATRVRT